MSPRLPRKMVKKQPSLEGFTYDGSTALPNLKQELFCVLYASNTTPRFFGNGKNAYAFAYGYQEKMNALEVGMIGADTRTGRAAKKKLSILSQAERSLKKMEHTCQTAASRLLLDDVVLTRCNYLMDQLASDKIVDRELVFVIQQRYELSSKVQAIVHYDKKKGRLVERHEDVIKFEPITSIEFVAPQKPLKK